MGSALTNCLFVGMEGTDAPCIPAFSWPGHAGEHDLWSSTQGAPAGISSPPPVTCQHST